MQLIYRYRSSESCWTASERLAFFDVGNCLHLYIRLARNLLTLEVVSGSEGKPERGVRRATTLPLDLCKL